MKTRQSSLIYLDHVFDFPLGPQHNNACLQIEATLSFRATPGEERIMYLPDGSGYPGSADKAELEGVTCAAISGEGFSYKFADCPELFLWFNRHLLDTSDPSDMEALFFNRYADSRDWPDQYSED